MTKKQKKMLARILIAAALFLAAELIPLRAVSTLLFFAAYFTVGWDILLRAGHGLRGGQMFDENFLMALATVGAIALAVYEKSGDYAEAVAVMLFYQLGELFQSYAVGRSRTSITALMDLRPDSANVERDGRLEQVDPDEVAVGTVIVVRPGEKIPIDGIVVEGTSALDTAALTGESLPRDVEAGSEVVSGCVNLTGLLRVRTTKAFGESTASKILELMESSAARKSRSESFITRFARVYTPAVCACALALAVLPPLISLLLGAPSAWSVWLYRALTFLVVSCPCALVISIPLSFFAGLGGAGKVGVLIKGSNYLEALAETRTVVFDKTGTLTRGAFEVTGIHRAALDEEKLLEYAALAESASTHPISKSLRRACGRALDLSRVADIRELSGRGVTATVDGLPVAAGNGRLMDELGIEWQDADSVGTVVHLAVDGIYAGHIVISDVEKSGAREAVDALRRAGVTKTVMLTGDSERAAAQVAEDLGLDEYRASLLPGDKVREVERLLEAQEKGAKLVFVGDGINDAPVLSRADIGIAMGAMGSDAAIEAADVVLMDDDPRKLARAIRISRKCLRIVRENIVFSIAIKLACLVLIALGCANMWMGIFADVGVMVLAVLNAVRALRVEKL